MGAAYTERGAGWDGSAREKLDEMTTYLESAGALAMTHDALERYVMVEGRELQRRLLQQHLDPAAGAWV